MVQMMHRHVAVPLADSDCWSLSSVCCPTWPQTWQEFISQARWWSMHPRPPSRPGWWEAMCQVPVPAAASKQHLGRSWQRMQSPMELYESKARWPWLPSLLLLVQKRPVGLRSVCGVQQSHPLRWTCSCTDRTQQARSTAVIMVNHSTLGGQW